MSSLIEFESEFGIILVESEEAPGRGTHSFGAKGNVLERAKNTFDQSVDILQDVSKTLVRKLNEVAIDLRPDKIEIKLGLKFSAEAGAFIAKTSGEGSIEITIKWINNK